MVHSRVRKLVEHVVDLSSRYATLVVFLTIALIGGLGFYIQSTLQLRTNLMELLPKDSPRLKALEHQLGRLGGGANILVVVESPDRAANEKVIDALEARINKETNPHRECTAKCKAEDSACINACGRNLIGYIESGTKDLHAYYTSNKWVYAELKDLQQADLDLDRQIAIQSGAVENLLDDAPVKGAPPAAPSASSGPGHAAVGAVDGGAPVNPEKKPALGMDPYIKKWDDAASKNDDYPTGYFCTPDGKAHGLRIVSTTLGFGAADSAELLTNVKAWMAEIRPEQYPGMSWGLGGDIPNAQAEKDSLVSDAVWATLAAILLILAGVVIYFRSPWSILTIALPTFLGAAGAFAFATIAFGYVNTAGLFLAAIIIGNGINYPIVLLGRYREFRARGQAPDEARRDAVWNAFRAELAGASVAAIAYGSLTFTRFRGFSQFGMIGFVGMFLVWLAIIPIVPAVIVFSENIQEKLPRFLRDPKNNIRDDGTSGPVMAALAKFTERFPVPIMVVALAIVAWSCFKALPFLKDPWEYAFDSLTSQSSHQTGAERWSSRADQVFGKTNIVGARLLADSPEQVPALRTQILANDAADPQGRLIDDILTVWEMLPGQVEEQQKKLEVLTQIRDRLTPGVLARLSESDRERVQKMTPPESLKVLYPKDLPQSILRRFSEKDGRVGTLTYVKFKDFPLSDGRLALRVSKTTDNVRLPSGEVVQTAGRSSIFADMIESMERDGPLASGIAFAAVAFVIMLATGTLRGAVSVLLALLLGLIVLLAGAAVFNSRLHYINFIAIPITLGIGCEYPFNIFDRSRLLLGDVSMALRRSGGPVALCSYTTIVGYGSLIFNDFGALKSFGKLAIAGEVAAVVSALVFLPALLHLWKPKGEPRPDV
jgi:uncharacterized protein